MKNINSLGQKIISSDNQAQLKRFWKWFGDSKIVDDEGDPLVVFHGSKTQFHTFDNSVNQDKERQMGAEFGFFFTDDITVARRFLNPNDSKNEYMQLRNDVFKNKDNFDAVQDINSYIKNLEFEKKYGGMSDADYEYCIKDVQDNINELCSLTGKNWNEMIEAIDLLRKMEQNIRDEQEENDKTLYQCYLKIENPKYYSGEIIGVGPERELALQSAFGSGYDGVIIYDADTGAGIANEYVVFDSAQIKSVRNSGYFNSTSKNIFESVFNDFRIKERSTGANSDETYMRLSLFDGDDEIGYISYSTDGDDVYVLMMETKPEYRRQGIMTRLAKHLQSKYPQTSIHWGMFTDDGHKWFMNQKKRIIPDIKYKTHLNYYNKLNKSVQKYQSAIDKKFGEDVNMDEETADRIIQAERNAEQREKEWAEKHNKTFDNRIDRQYRKIRREEKWLSDNPRKDKIFIENKK